MRNGRAGCMLRPSRALVAPHDLLVHRCWDLCSELTLARLRAVADRPYLPLFFLIFTPIACTPAHLFLTRSIRRGDKHTSLLMRAPAYPIYLHCHSSFASAVCATASTARHTAQTRAYMCSPVSPRRRQHYHTFFLLSFVLLCFVDASQF
jgi:hypothetical protein